MDLEAILANLLLDKRKQDREVGYGGKLEILPTLKFINNKCLQQAISNLIYMYVIDFPDGLVIILSAITSHLRVAQVHAVYYSLCLPAYMYMYVSWSISIDYATLSFPQFVVSKIQALEMMKRISHHVTDECILERIVPFLVSQPPPPCSLLH